MCNRVTGSYISCACVSVPWTWSWKEAALALQYFERSGLKVSEGLGMVMEMAIQKFGPKRYRGVGEWVEKRWVPLALPYHIAA